jgi:large subunit ribosomal protein L15
MNYVVIVKTFLYTGVRVSELINIKLSDIDFDVLKAHGLASKNDLVKILGRGEVKSKLEVKAHAFTATAQKAIEAAGGTSVKL